MTPPSAPLTTALSDRYRLIRELGAGGMATVYLAEDLKHHRQVAIKVLKPEIAAALGAERFLREIETTAGLHHPHILALYDSGEAEGFLYYVMPLVEGESLRDRLKREKQLPLDDALQIAREVADALSYAHSKGVVHRDIKPENVLLESGHAMVADFGIAKAVSAAGGETLTQTGMAIGTPQYMSPEQAAGGAAGQELDGRSDLYSLGCVLYEMLAGQPPFTGPTIESVIRQHLAAEPRSITVMRPAVPAEVAAALQRALAKTPADRFNPVALFSEAIRPGRPQAAPSISAAAPAAPVAPPPPPAASPPSRPSLRPVLATAAVLVVLGGFIFWRRSTGSGSGGATAASVAVLPFNDLSPDRTSAYFGDGLAETLINALANVEGLSVAARTSAFSFRDKAEDVREIGKQLGVATVLEGSVQRSGNRLRVTAQLIKTSDGLHLWSQSFDRSSADIFAVQDEVARAVVTALSGRLLPGKAALASVQTTRNSAAYDAYLQGLFFWNRRTEADINRAIGFYSQAIALDSGFAEAWTGLAQSYVVLPFFSLVPSSETAPKAKAAAERSLQLKPELGPAHATLAYTLANHDWQWVRSDSEFRRAVTLSPGDGNGHKWYTDLLMMTGQMDAALREERRALELDPLSPNVISIMGEWLWSNGRDADALAQVHKALELDPSHPLALEYAMRIAWLQQDTASYFGSRQRLEAVSGRIAPATAELRRLFASGGRKAVLQAQLAAPAATHLAIDRARWHGELGDLDAAFADLEQAYREHDVRLWYATYWPDYAPLWKDPRFAALKARAGLK